MVSARCSAWRPRPRRSARRASARRWTCRRRPGHAGAMLDAADTAQASTWLRFRSELQRAAEDLAGGPVRLVTRDGWPWGVIGAVLAVVTLGRFRRATFLSRFATTIGPVIALPRTLTLRQAWGVLPHEARHARQMRLAGAGWPWLGAVVFGIAYVFLLVPMGLAVFRAWAELDAEVQSWRYRLATRRGPEMRDDIERSAIAFASVVGSAVYGWALPAPILRRWYLSRARAVVREAGAG